MLTPGNKNGADKDSGRECGRMDPSPSHMLGTVWGLLTHLDQGRPYKAAQQPHDKLVLLTRSGEMLSISIMR